MRRRHFIISAGLGAVGASMARPRSTQAQDVRWQYDGQGTLARVGVLTPDFDPVPESEMWAMVPRGVSIHAARVPRGAGAGHGFADPPYVDDAVDRLAALTPHSILFAYTSSSYALGAEASDQVRIRLEQRSKGIPMFFTCTAATAAFQLLDVQHISVVHPPWFSEASNEQGRHYWRDAGFDVVECTPIRPARSFTEVPPDEIFNFVSTHTPRGAEAVFIGGNGLRAVGTIRALEERLQKPVLSANQVVLWYALHAIGQADSVVRYGSIFSKRSASRSPT